MCDNEIYVRMKDYSSNISTLIEILLTGNKWKKGDLQDKKNWYWPKYVNVLLEKF